MAESHANPDLPPDYAADAAAVQEGIPPDTLRLAGRYIHSANSRNIDAPGIFEINHQIDFLRETDTLVEFSRIDYSIKKRAYDSGLAPEIVSNPRHIFNLERPPAIIQEAFPYYIKPTSRSGLGSIGLKFLKIGKSECKAWLVGRKANNRIEYEARELLFDVRRNNEVFDWLDRNGSRLAVEEAQAGMYSLNILVSLDRAMRDALSDLKLLKAETGPAFRAGAADTDAGATAYHVTGVLPAKFASGRHLEKERLTLWYSLNPLCTISAVKSTPPIIETPHHHPPHLISLHGKSHPSTTTMDGPYARELATAIAAIQHGAKLSRRVLVKDDKGVVTKEDLSPVTVADFAIQALLTSTLHAAFPDDKFVGEESAADLRENPELLASVWALLQQVENDKEADSLCKLPASPEEMCDMIDWCGLSDPSPTGRFWVFDPIDGTKTFVRGELYAINVCLMEDGKQSVGIVGLPLLSADAKAPINNDSIDPTGTGSIMFAVRGHGTFIRPLPGPIDLAPAKIPRHADVDTQSLVSVTCIEGSESGAPGIHQKVANRLGVAYPGNDLLGWVLRWTVLGLGQANCTFWAYRRRDRLAKIWDHAGAMLLFEEVGGKVTDVDGNPVNLVAGRKMKANYGFIAAPPSVHARVLEAVRETLREEGLHELLG
ncbi:3',5'-bisphosphate nucleotidase [Colletotrichum orchidophilum]|uniref:3',5'-bisphosphate nucleotidase n=1 Tax=Colletotrichum orchidophilum TaxID=1209926 RepID=A0A1G4BH96_9PEZI|nr:3',5'-bisphosphate nucleotidase [Colletotrichum orchidophilum]OHF00703.1 3',5'-bisphosphate nucleotidase [Colletotrichum orchidophilum]